MSRKIKWENTIFRIIALLGILMFAWALFHFRGELSRTDTILLIAGIVVLAVLAIFCGGPLFGKKRRHKHHHHHTSSSHASRQTSSGEQHHHHHSTFSSEGGHADSGVKRTTSDTSLEKNEADEEEAQEIKREKE